MIFRFRNRFQLCSFYKFYISVYKLVDPIEDACEKFNGIFGIRSEKAVCCSRRCPKCGGKGCAKWKDTSMTMDNGKTLGAHKCCKWKIIKRGKKCGSNGQEAPCKL